MVAVNGYVVVSSSSFPSFPCRGHRVQMGFVEAAPGARRGIVRVVLRPARAGQLQPFSEINIAGVTWQLGDVAIE